MKFHEWLATAWTNLLSWFGVEEQKIASLLYPILKDAVQIIKKDLWADLLAAVPIVKAALTTGGIGAALVAAEEFIVPLLTTQGVELEQTTVNTLSNALVAQAQAAPAEAAPVS